MQLKVNNKTTEVLLTASSEVHSTVWPADGAAGDCTEKQLLFYGVYLPQMSCQ